MQKFKSNLQDAQGRAIRNAPVTVVDLNGTAAQLYSANDLGSIMVNPVYTNDQGEFSFYAADGRYSLQIQAPGFTPESDIDVVLLQDPVNLAKQPAGFKTTGNTGDAFYIQDNEDSGKPKFLGYAALLGGISMTIAITDTKTPSATDAILVADTSNGDAARRVLMGSVWSQAPQATTSTSGSMSAADKGKLDNLVSPFVSYGGTANAIVLTSTPARTALSRGGTIAFRATVANTGATTINLDGLGAVAATTVTGSALPAGYIRTDVDTFATYNGTNWVVGRQVERGSNANGTFTRYADGALFCTLPSSTPSVPTGRTLWSFVPAAAFAASPSPVVSASCAPSSNYDFYVAYTYFDTLARVEVRNTTGAQTVSVFGGLITGRWY